MSLHESMQVRFDRLNNNEFRAQDITKLFLYLRQLSPKNRVVAEVGHFIAHPERDRGMLPELMFDTFTLGQWAMEKLERRVTKLDDLPHNIGDILQVARKRKRNKLLRRETGLTTGQIDKSLRRLIAQIVPNETGRMRMTSPLLVGDFNLFKILIRDLIVDVAFTQNDLFDDFQSAARTANLLGKEQQLPSHVSSWLTLTAIESMHNAVLEYKNWKTTLLAGTSYEGTLHVTMKLDAP